MSEINEFLYLFMFSAIYTILLLILYYDCGNLGKPDKHSIS